jgi:hypothetical protein
MECPSQVNYDQIEIQQLENHYIFFDVMFIWSLSYLQPNQFEIAHNVQSQGVQKTIIKSPYFL